MSEPTNIGLAATTTVLNFIVKSPFPSDAPATGGDTNPGPNGTLGQDLNVYYNVSLHRFRLTTTNLSGW
jgi:hypothetical protein